MIVFQIVDVGLKARSVGDANTGTRTCLVRNDEALVAVGIKHMRLLWLQLRCLRLLYLLRLRWLLLRFRLLRILSLFRLRLSLLRVLRLLF